MRNGSAPEAIIPKFLRVDFINPAVDAVDKTGLIREMVALADRTGLLLDRKGFWEGLLARESIASTGGSGCALLHPQVVTAEMIFSSFMVLGRTPRAMTFGALDQLEVDIFFVIGCRDRVTYGRVLDRVSRMIVRTSVLHRLRQACDGPGMFQAMVECEQELLGSTTCA